MYVCNIFCYTRGWSTGLCLMVKNKKQTKLVSELEDMLVNLPSFLRTSGVGELSTFSLVTVLFTTQV